MTTPKGEDQSRADLYRESEQAPPYPEEWVGSYVVNMFFEVGPLTDERPVTWSELEAYSNLLQVDLTPWEAQTIVEMSRAFAEELNISKNPLSIEPLERDYGSVKG